MPYYLAIELRRRQQGEFRSDPIAEVRRPPRWEDVRMVSQNGRAIVCLMIASGGAGAASGIRFRGSEDGRWFSIRPAAGEVANDRRAALQVATASIGIAFCIEDTVNDLVEADKLVPPLLARSKPFPGFFQSDPHQRHMPAAARRVIDAIRAGALDAGLVLPHLPGTPGAQMA